MLTRRADPPRPSSQELEHIHFKQRAGANTEQARRDWNKYYCEIHMFITRAPKEPVEVPPMVSAPAFVPLTEKHQPVFTVLDLYALMRNPPVPSKAITETMRSVASPGSTSSRSTRSDAST